MRGPESVSCVGAVEAEARARDVRLETRVDPADPPVRIARDKVERVLSNLLSNAMRHTPDRGAVSVVVEPNSDHVVVAVEDTGVGLSPRATQRISTVSGAPTTHGRAVVRGSGSRSRRGSSRRTAGRSGRRTDLLVARESRSRCRLPDGVCAASRRVLRVAVKATRA